MRANDPYAVLGVGRDASHDEIRRAYRRLAREYHPDANPDDAHAEERFKDVQNAHEILSDPEKRREYDEGPLGGFFGRSGGFGANPGPREGPRRRPPRPKRGDSVAVGVNLTFREAFEGVATRVSAPAEEACEVCGGEGVVPAPYGERPCARCKGSGGIKKTRQITVKIPPGAREGTKVRIPGKGNAGKHGGSPGDLYVVARVEKHPVFERRGDDFLLDAPVGLVEAALGGDIEVPQPAGGTTRLRLPPAAQDGKRFRLRGLGAPKARGDSPPGDLVVRIRIAVPTRLSGRARELLEYLAEELDEDARGELLRLAREAEHRGSPRATREAAS